MESFVYRSVSGSRDRSRVHSRGRSRARVTRSAAAALVSCALLCAVPAASQAGSSGEMSKRAGLGAASALTSLVYAPLKMVYALGGLVVGGLAWAFSGGDNEVAKVVLTPSILGDYVVTPSQLKGDEPLEFFGRDPDYQADELDVAAAPTPTVRQPEPAW